jgi:hypothetical protein
MLLQDLRPFGHAASERASGKASGAH